MSVFQAPPGMHTPMYGVYFSVGLVRMVRKALVFVGRASRSEYWWGLLGLIIADVAISIAKGLILGPATLMSGAFGSNLFIGFSDLATVPLELLSLLLCIPQLSLSFRRLHDANTTGWLGLLILVPGLGWIASLIFGFLPTTENERFENSV